MSPKDKISKSALNLVESAKDSVTNNVMSAAKSGQLKIDSATMQVLLMIVNASIDEGFHKGHNVFSKTVDASLKEAATPVPSVVTKKNKS